MGTRSEDFYQLVEQLAEVERIDSAHWSTFKVRGHTFGYLWEATQTVGLKQTLCEQLALVAERPDTSRFSTRPGSSAGSWSTWPRLTAGSSQS